MLDVEPIHPNKGELISVYRLPERVCRNYPKAFEVVVGDGLYLNGNTFNLPKSHHKYTAAVLKDERRCLYKEAILLSGISSPAVCKQEKIPSIESGIIHRQECGVDTKVL